MGTKNRLADKLEALDTIRKLGVDIAPTLGVSSSTYLQTIATMADQGADYWVVRATQLQKESFSKPAYAASDLKTVLKKFFAQSRNARLLITTLVPAWRSGAVVKGIDFVYLEYVPGALQSMLRDGVTPTRILFTRNEQILCIQHNCPEFMFDWHNAELFRVLDIDPSRLDLSSEAINQCLKIARLCSEYSLVEWVESEAGRVFAVDVKTVPSGFLGTSGDILEGIRKGGISSFPSLSTMKTSLTRILEVEKPLYLYLLDPSTFMVQRICCKAGALLSHFVVNCANNGIECIVKNDTRRLA
jgi:hypothetical protein